MIISIIGFILLALLILIVVNAYWAAPEGPFLYRLGFNLDLFYIFYFAIAIFLSCQ